MTFHLGVYTHMGRSVVQDQTLQEQAVGEVTLEARTWCEPKGGRAKGALAGCVWRFNAKRKMHLQGPRPWWWVAGRCLCRSGFAGWCNC